MQPKNQVNIKDLYECSVQQIEYEQGLINNRISWMLTFQGFLFGSMALVASDNSAEVIRMTFKTIVPLLGILTSSLAIVGIYASCLTIDAVRRRWKSHPNSCEYIATLGLSKASIAARITSYGIPASTIFAWLSIMAGLRNLT